MKIMQAITQLDGLIPNIYSTEEKVQWLSQVEGLVLATVFPGKVFDGYDGETDVETEMLIPKPFDAIYLRWLEAQVHYYNGEMDRYNNAILVYRDLLESYSAHVGRLGGSGKQSGQRFRY